MIKIEQFIVEGKESIRYKKMIKKMEDFLNEIGKEKIINITASPDMMIKAGQGCTPPTCFTIFYEE